MRPEAFSPQQQKHLVPTDRNQVAFVPPPLPSSFDLSHAAILALSAADRAIGALDGIGK